jgi:uncharacterized protein with HEPN domain
MLDEDLKDDLLLILEHLDEITAYFSEINQPADFFSTLQGKAYYDAILMHLQVTGEILKKCYLKSNSVFENYLDVPWNEIIRMRDLISHHYDKLEHEIVFDICKHYLQPLRSALQSIVNSGQ